MSKRRIAISAGHSNISGKDMGAHSEWAIEGTETVILRNLIVDEFEKRKEPVSVDPDSNVTYKTVALFKQYFGKEDIVLDIHFNSSINSMANGTEIILPDNYDEFEKELGLELCDRVAKTLGIRNRGIKPESSSARKKLLWMTIPSKNILLEVCFLSNPNDWAAYKAKKSFLASEIAYTLLKYKYLDWVK